MKRLIAILLGVLLLLGVGACKSEQITFTGTIKEIGENSILVSTEDLEAADLASVGFAEDLKVDFNFIIGQKVRITIKPEIRTSYPVQVTAVRIQLVQQDVEEKSEMKQTKGTYATIAPADAKELLDSGADVVFLDVRTSSEYAEGHIDGSVLLTDSDIPTKAEAVLTDKEQTIVVYCRSGRRSEAAAKVLIEMGYLNVLDLGGIIDWPYEVVK